MDSDPLYPVDPYKVYSLDVGIHPQFKVKRLMFKRYPRTQTAIEK